MTNQLPPGAKKLADTYPDVWSAYDGLGEACASAGPLDPRTRRLVKLALAIGGGSEGAVHSHARRAVDEGLSAEALRQVAVLSITTLGLPRGVAAMTWIDDVVEGG